jgi:hypothetical protein
LNETTALTVAAAGVMFASVALAEDAGVSRADPLESDIANGVQPNRAYAGQPKIIWRTPEIRPRTFEQQREFDRSSQASWLFPPTETGEE